MSLIKNLLILSIFLLLLGCETTNTTHSKSEGIDLNLDAMGLHNLNKSIEPGHSRLTIKRAKKMLYLALRANVHVNGSSLVKLSNGKATIYDIKSGQTTISVNAFAFPGRWTMNFNTEPGENYFIEITPRGESFIWGVGFGFVGAVVDSAISENSGGFKMNIIKQKK
ncbi:MAG: hypothetical protein CFH27_00568 [Alphaproteobacteria bacterium MarineAlpha6_Bin5]|nr:MAG: hypothetical protein CFH27_00568 [Alphaproteobacteria bacterium MarineAlpha6_Bin5]|tara:strand:+ start:87 stop:587 length:501 start_codon:yes stop_codon:yes gene_type:complete